MTLRILALVAALTTVATGCHKDQKKIESPNTATPQITKPETKLTTPTLTPKAKAPVTLKITSPKEGEIFPAKEAISVNVSFKLSGYEIQNEGQYIQVILDNNPGEAYYDLSKAFTFKNPIPLGTHTIRAFPMGGPMTQGLSQNESLKDPDAFAMVTFSVGKPDQKNTVKVGEPILTFSRPKGEYIGEKAKSIMLDFWVKNAELGPDKYKVNYQVNNGTVVSLTEWKKIFLVGFPLGENTIEMWLVGPDGNEVTGALNHVTRKITLKEFAQKPLFERLGGQAAIEAIVGDFLLFISNDLEINKRFAKINIKELQKQLMEEACEQTGGPCTRAGEPVAEAYAEIKFKDKEFEALTRDLVAALNKNKIAEKEQKEILTALGKLRAQNIKK
jgi:truncated hemoglobin YjbI